MPRAPASLYRIRLPAPLIAGLAAAVLWAGHAVAQPVPMQGQALPLQARQGGMSLDQAIELAERRFRARVVRANVEESGGQRIYVLRLLSEQGRVWTVRVDAASGSIS
jgi:hypothetical protein